MLKRKEGIREKITSKRHRQETANSTSLPRTYAVIALEQKQASLEYNQVQGND